MSHVMRKPVFRVCDQVRHKPACSATETSSSLNILDLANICIMLSRQQTSKALIGVRGCTGWSAPLYGIRHVSSWHGSYTCKHFINIVFSSPEPLVVRRPSSTIFKDLLLQNQLAYQSQISYGASVGQGNESLLGGVWVTWTRWPPGPYVVKTLQKSSSPEPNGQWPCGFICSIGDAGPIIVCSNDDPRLTLTYFTARSNLVPYAFIWGKTVRKSFNGRNLQQMTRVTKGLC